MHTVLVLLFVALAVFAVGVVVLFAGSELVAWAARRRPEGKKADALRKKLGRRQPWVAVPAYALPAAGTARAVATDSHYRLRGVERSRGIRRRPLHVFVSEDPKLYAPSGS